MKNLNYKLNLKIMKAKFILLITLATVGLAALSQNSDQISELDEILAAANAGKDHFLGIIPIGEESFYGFNTRDEFSLVQLGNPYKVVALDYNFYGDNIIKEKNYIMEINEWIIPLKINDDYRVLLTISKMSGVWKTVNIGSARLAKELDEFESKHSLSDENLMLLYVYKPYCNFILFYPESNTSVLKAFPVNSAVIAFEIPNTDIFEDSLDNTLEMIKNKTL